MKITNGKGDVAKGKDVALKALIKKNLDMFKMALPKTITPERMMRIAMTAISMNGRLASCTQTSFFGSLLTAAQLGLEVNTPLGQAYLIPYDTKNGLLCQFQLGYQGMLELAYRTGKFKRIKACVVYRGDEFRYSYGLNAVLEHKPSASDDPIYVYALYELINGGVDFEVWTWQRVMEHGRRYSKSFNNGPWKINPEEMAKKTVLKALLKYAPKAVELSEAVASDECVIQKELVLDAGDVQIVDKIECIEEVKTETPMKFSDDASEVRKEVDMEDARTSEDVITHDGFQKKTEDVEEPSLEAEFPL